MSLYKARPCLYKITSTKNTAGAIQKLCGQDEVVSWSVKCLQLSMLEDSLKIVM